MIAIEKYNIYSKLPWVNDLLLTLIKKRSLPTEKFLHDAFVYIISLNNQMNGNKLENLYDFWIVPTFKR